MFQNSYQGSSSIELLSAQGKNPLKEWKTSGKIEKVFDKTVKCSIFSMETPGASLVFPKTEKSGMSIIQPFLVLQVFLPAASPLNIEVAITDSKKARRRLMFTSSTKEFHLNPLHARVPIQAFHRNVWTNISLDIVSFSNFCFKGSTFRAIEQVIIKPHCKIRRIFTMPRPLQMYEYATPLPGEVIIGQDPYENDEHCPVSPIIPKKLVGDPLPKAQEFPLGVQNITQVFNSHIAQFYCKSSTACQTPDEQQSAMLESMCGGFGPQSTSYSKKLLSAASKSITSSGFAPRQNSKGAVPLSAQSRLFVTTQESFKQNDTSQTPLLKKDSIKEPLTQNKNNKKLLNKINQAVSSVREQHKKKTSARSNSSHLKNETRNSRSSVLELSKKNSVGSPFTVANGSISHKSIRNSHNKISPGRGVSAHSTIEVDVSSRDRYKASSRSPSFPRVGGGDVSMLAGLSSGGFEVIEEITKKGPSANPGKVPVLQVGRKNSLHKKLGKGPNTTATTNFTTTESWNPQAVPHYQRRLFAHNNKSSSRSPHIDRSKQSLGAFNNSPIQEEKTNPALAGKQRIPSANQRPPLAKKSTLKSPNKRWGAEQDESDHQKRSPLKIRHQRAARGSLVSRNKDTGTFSQTEISTSVGGHTRTLSKPEGLIKSRIESAEDSEEIMNPLQEKKEIVVKNEQDSKIEDEKEESKGEQVDFEDSNAPRFNTHQFRLSTFEFARKMCPDDDDSDADQVQEEIQSHSQSKGSPVGGRKKCDQIQKERNDLARIDRLGCTGLLLQTHDADQVEEQIQITPIDDIKINGNVSPDRPYTPPFAQHINPNETTSKFNMMVDSLEKHQLSIEEQLQQDSLEIPKQATLDVVFDPVLKCYYDPKNNSYYELNN